MSNVKVTVAYFAEARQCTGIAEEKLELPAPARLEQLFSKVMSIHPALAEMRTDNKYLEELRPLVNGTWASEETELKDGDRVALLPPVSGG